jgi:hypothetical protein
VCVEKIENRINKEKHNKKENNTWQSKMLNLPIKNKLICSYKKHECGKNNSLPRVRSEENMQKVRQKGSKYNSFILSNKEK